MKKTAFEKLWLKKIILKRPKDLKKHLWTWQLFWYLSYTLFTHLEPPLLTHSLYWQHFLISIYISSLHSGNILECLDLLLSGALRPAFVYCMTLGQRSGMQNRRERHTGEAISRTIPSILHSTPTFILNFTRCLRKHIPDKLAPSGNGALFYAAEHQETGSFDRNKFNSVKSYKMNIVQK